MVEGGYVRGKATDKSITSTTVGKNPLEEMG